jgi:hypothetical protein
MRRLVRRVGNYGTYQIEKRVSGWWLEPEVQEDIYIEFEYTIEDQSFDAYGPMGEARTYASFGTHINRLISAYGKDTGADYTNYLKDSETDRFLDHLAECVNEDLEM